MNFKTTYVLFGVLAVLLATLGIALFLEPVSPEASDYLLPSVHKKGSELKPEEVDRVEIQRNRPEVEKLVFTRDADGKTWKMTEPFEARADSFAVSGLARDVLEAKREPAADTPPSLSEYGLDPPTEVVTVSKGDREVKLNVGDSSPGKENQVVYVTSSEKPKEGTSVRKSSLETVFKKVNDFRDKTLLANSDVDIQSIKISEPKKEPVALTKVDQGNWKYTEPAYGSAEMEGEPPPPGPPGAAPADKAPSGVRPLLNDLTGLRVDKSEDFVADNVDDKDLAKYNLEPAKDPVLRIEIEKSGGAKDEKKPASKSALLVGVGKQADGKYYARLDGERSVVKVAAKDVDPLRKLLDERDALRDRALVRFENFKNPDAVEVKNATGTFDLIRADAAKPWELYRGDNAVKADDKSIQDVVNQLTQKNIVRAFPPLNADQAKLGLDKPTAVVSLWVDGVVKDEKKEEKPDEKKEDKKDEKTAEKKDAKKDEKKEEKKPARPKLKDQPTVRLSFGNVDSNLVAVKRESGGETSLMKVPVSILDNVKNGPLFYADRTLPKFNAADPLEDVTKLVIVRNGGTTELTKDAKAASPAVAWKIDKPAALAGRTADANAVDTIIRVLDSLRAVKLVTETAEPEVVDREFGLKTPSMKATVTVTKDGKATDYEYEFGKDADATKTYARQGQRPKLVFEVDKGDLAPLSRDLQDPTIFRFDAAKAKTLKLTGWKDVTGTPTTLEFERKDASTWTAKAPKDFNVSSDKVNRLVTGLSSERAVKFLDRKATQKEREDDGLTPEKGALVIEVTVEGEKEPFVLSVGNLEPDKAAYFATANRLGEALFTVSKDVFEKPKEKPAFFNP
jgi:Domain of unknown function (DUF4340)